VDVDKSMRQGRLYADVEQGWKNTYVLFFLIPTYLLCNDTILHFTGQVLVFALWIILWPLKGPFCIFLFNITGRIDRGSPGFGRRLLRVTSNLFDLNA